MNASFEIEKELLTSVIISKDGVTIELTGEEWGEIMEAFRGKRKTFIISKVKDDLNHSFNPDHYIMTTN